VIFTCFDDENADFVAMTFVVIGKAEKGAVVAFDISTFGRNVGRPRFSADFQPGVLGRDSGSLRDNLFENLLHRSGRRRLNHLPAMDLRFPEAEFASVVGLQIIDDSRRDESPGVVKDIVSLKKLNESCLHSVTVGLIGPVGFLFQFPGRFDPSGKLSGEIDARALPQAESSKAIVHLFTAKTPGDLGNTDVGGVDDDVGSGEGVEGFVVGDFLMFSDIERAAVIGVEPGLGSDAAVIEGYGQGKRFDDRSGFVGILGKFWLELGNVFLGNVSGIIAFATGQGEETTGTTLHNCGNDLLGSGFLFHSIERRFDPFLQSQRYV